MKNYRFANGTAILTGAASGIGEALAHGLAQRGSHLILLDRDADRLAAVAQAIAVDQPTITVKTEIIDLCDTAATDAIGAHLAGVSWLAV